MDGMEEARRALEEAKTLQGRTAMLAVQVRTALECLRRACDDLRDAVEGRPSPYGQEPPMTEITCSAQPCGRVTQMFRVPGKAGLYVPEDGWTSLWEHGRAMAHYCPEDAPHISLDAFPVQPSGS